MNRTLKSLALNSAHRSGLLRSLHYFDFSHHSLYVLVYHRVDWESGQPRLDPNNLSATPAQFEQQMRLLAKEYNPVTAEDVLAVVTSGKKLPPRAVLVTVDDAYRDFKDYIWPIAQRHRIYPLLFVPTSFIGSGVFWWDQLYDALNRSNLKEIETPVGTLSLESLSQRSQAFACLADYMKMTPFDSALGMINNLCRKLVADPFVEGRITLDWVELRELAYAGVTIAPHTHTHPAVGNIAREQTHFEISEAERLIKTEIGASSTLFAYPYGTPQTIGHAGEILREMGYQLAFTMIPGRARLDTDDRMYTPRIEVNPQIGLAKFHARLSPVYDAWKSRKKSFNSN